MEMTRESALAQYRPIRAGMRRVLRLAATACNPADLKRAVKQVAPWADQKTQAKSEAAEMVMDVALFEPNQRRRRAYDRFLEEKASELDAPDRALAQSMAAAWFSIFYTAGRHDVAGIWLEDLLDSNRRIWVLDEGLEASAPAGIVIGMRLFNAGPFHAGFGIVTQPDDDTTHFATAARAGGNPLPFRQSLAATLYGDELREEHQPAAAALIQHLPELLEHRLLNPRNTLPSAEKG